MAEIKIPPAKPLIEEEEIEAVKRVLKSGRLTQGPVTEEFEREFAKYNSVKYAIAVSSGTAALYIALIAAGVKPGDEVITTSYTFIATANTIVYAGAIPVFADINPDTYNIDPKSIEEAITSRTKAILIVHLFGQPCDVDPIIDIAREHNLVLIEDCAQAHGALYKGRMVGTFGDVACYSFYPTKNMTTGEGGMIVTNNREIAEKARLIRNHGQVKRYEHAILGFNFRMTDIQAAIGLVQLKKLEQMIKARVKRAKQVSDELENVKNITPPYEMPGVRHVYSLYAPKLEGNHEKARLLKLIAKLQEKGVGAREVYPEPIYKQPLYQDIMNEEKNPYAKLFGREVSYKDCKCKNAEDIVKQVFQLPLYPSMTDEEVEYMVNCVKESVKEVFST